MSGPDVEVVVPSPVGLAEGPIWDDRRGVLWWVDVFGGRLHRFDPGSGADTARDVGARLGSVGLCTGNDLLLARDRTVLRYDPERETLEPVASVECGTWLNDGASDPAGRFLVGTMVDERDAGGAALYQVAGGAVSLLLDSVTISNGLDWSSDGTTLYYVDTPLEQVDAFDYDPISGRLANRRVFADLHDVPGRPDGLTVDADGGVWVAMARGGAAVRRFTPDGMADIVLNLPVPNVTSIAFGGADLDDLYVTTSQLRLTAADLARFPLSGCVFRAAGVGWAGRASNRYAD